MGVTQNSVPLGNGVGGGGGGPAQDNLPASTLGKRLAQGGLMYGLG